MAQRDFAHNPYTPINASVEADIIPISPPPRCTWRLSLDGELKSNAARSVTHLVLPKTRRPESALSHPARNGELQRPSCLQQQHQKQQPQPQTNQKTHACDLEPWEAKAVQVYRSIRGFRQTTTATVAKVPCATASEALLPAQVAAARARLHEPKAAAGEVLVPPAVWALLSTPAHQQIHSHAGVSAESVPSDPFVLSREDHDGSPYGDDASLSFTLHELLRFGYPLQFTPSPSAASAIPRSAESATVNQNSADAYTRILVSAADRFASAFSTSQLAADPQEPAQPLRLSLFPSMVARVVVAHAMSPRSTATWLSRVFVGMLQAEHGRLHTLHLLQHKASAVKVPMNPLPPRTLETIHSYAAVVQEAAYALQGNVLPVVRLDARTAHATLDLREAFHDSDDEERDTVETAAMARSAAAAAGGEGRSYVPTNPKPEEWVYFHLLVLQETISLLLRGCLEGDDERSNARDDQSMRAVGLAPAVTSSSVGLEGLVQLAFLMRNHYDTLSAARQCHLTDVSGHGTYVTPSCEPAKQLPWTACTHSEQRVLHAVEKRWVAFAERATQQLGELTYNYYRYIPLLCFALAIR